MFEVMARNKDGDWSGAPARLPVRLRPHYYQATWFWALCGFGVVAFAVGVYALRVRGMEARAARLAVLVDDRTRELRAEIEPAPGDFTGISTLAEPGEILVGEFHDVGHRDHPHHAGAVGGVVDGHGDFCWPQKGTKIPEKEDGRNCAAAMRWNLRSAQV